MYLETSIYRERVRDATREVIKDDRRNPRPASGARDREGDRGASARRWRASAIPVLLGGLGLGSAWLTGIAIVTAPHRIALVAAAVISLVGAGAVLARYRRALACAPERACGKSAVTSLVIGFVSLGAVLTIAGYFFA